MMLHSRLVTCLVVLALDGAAVESVFAAPWVKGFVVNRYEYAFRFGGREGFAQGDAIEPGVDCVRGADTAFYDEAQTRVALSQEWRTQEELDAIVNLPGAEKMKDPLFARMIVWNRAAAYRGFKRGVATYVNPWAAEDPGIPEVVSRIGEGLDLDGKIKPTDFVSPDGEMGIDDNLYRALGCVFTYRRGVDGGAFRFRANNAMRDGRVFTMVVRLSGNQDPSNDSDVTVEIGYSPDDIGKDARGYAAADFTYRLPRSEQYTKMKGTIVTGLLETEQVARIHAPRPAWYYSQTGDVDLHQGKIRLKIAPDGQTAAGLMAGYRNWYDLYADLTFAQDGGQQGVREHEDHIAIYYALRRNADGLYNQKSGRFDGISSAYRIELASAFVTDPIGPMEIRKQMDEEHKRQGFQIVKAATVRGADTRAIQPVPPGTTEAAVGRFELNPNVTNLPGYKYLLKVLDRPHYPDEDAKGLPPWIYTFDGPPRVAQPKEGSRPGDEEGRETTEQGSQQ